MADAYVEFGEFPAITSGFTILFSTNYIADAVGVMMTLPGFEISHEYTGGQHVFTIDGVVINYTGSINTWQSIAFVFNASQSKVYLYVDGNLVGSGDNLRGPLSAGVLKVGGNKEYAINDPRIYSKVLSAGAIQYYNDDAKQELLSVSRLG